MEMGDEEDRREGLNQWGALQAQMRRSHKLMGKQMEIIEALLSTSDVDTVNIETCTLDKLYQDISEAIIRTTAPPLCSSKGGTAHGEQERNFKLVIRGQIERSPMVTVPVKEGK